MTEEPNVTPPLPYALEAIGQKPRGFADLLDALDELRRATVRSVVRRVADQVVLAVRTPTATDGSLARVLRSVEADRAREEMKGAA